MSRTDDPGVSAATEAPLPAARLRARKPGVGLLPWMIPLAVALAAAVLAAQAISARGVRVDLSFRDGRGLRAGDPVVSRGVEVGRVLAVGLGKGGDVRVRIELARDAAHLAQGGRFWIVHPEISLTRVSGLETIVGPRYIEADGEGRSSAGAAGGAGSGPAIETRESPPPRPGDGLRIVIRAPRAGSLSAGSPVSYREVPVGRVTHVELATDARSVRIHAEIQPDHAHLVRSGSRFWNVSGIGLDLGIVSGLKFKAESLQTVLAGGLAFATPDRPDDGPVSDGAEFTLDEFDEAYLKWSPDLTRDK